jgi:hypothetical protein
MATDSDYVDAMDCWATCQTVAQGDYPEATYCILLRYTLLSGLTLIAPLASAGWPAHNLPLSPQFAAAIRESLQAEELRSASTIIV